MTQPNSTSSCDYSKQCPSFDFKSCASLNYMQSCSKLNQYLIKSSPEDRHEHIDYNTDLGLLRCIKQ